MTIGERLKEERLRLGLSQTALASAAGATKSAQIGWEKNSSAPNAVVLAAFAEAGVDVLYVLTGARTADASEDKLLDFAERLESIRRIMIEPERAIWTGGNSPEASEHILRACGRDIRSMLARSKDTLNPELRERAEQLLDIAQDEAKLREFRAAEAIALRQRKEQMKRRLASALEGIDPPPGETVSYLLLQLAVDHGVPTRTLGDLWEQIQADAADRRDA